MSARQDAQRKRSHQRLIPLPDGDTIFARYLPGKPGAIPLVLHDGLGCDGYIWRSLVQWFHKRHPIVHWQYRGHGKSSVPHDIRSLTLTEVIGDLEIVLDEFGIDRAVHLGHSMGVQIALEAYRHISERIAGLVLMCGSFEYPIRSWHASPYKDGPISPSNLAMRASFEKLTSAMINSGQVSQTFWSFLLALPAAYQVATRTEVNGQRLAFRDFGPYMKHLSHMDCRVFAQFARLLANHSAADLLPNIKEPTLIVGAGRDSFTPVWQSLEMHDKIPQSELLLLDDGTHSAPLEFTTDVNQCIQRFLVENYC